MIRKPWNVMFAASDDDAGHGDMTPIRFEYVHAPVIAWPKDRHAADNRRILTSRPGLSNPTA
ncbi:hypothetical protein B9H02_05245 [Prosthecochloris sp. HL-130-GSB]|jgi:hypothetical protein|nr:hypothetical protein B9H02_05245 [Prosthecochloris sp. HL-130-GSB]